VGKFGIIKKSAAVAAGGVVIVSALAFTTAGSAAAATTANQFTLCATGNYAAYVTFPDRGKASSFVAEAGTCQTVKTTGDTSEHITVFGLYNTHPDVHFTVGSFVYNDAVGGGADAAGTTTAPKLERW
jgi:hypothetical protein